MGGRMEESSGKELRIDIEEIKPGDERYIHYSDSVTNAYLTTELDQETWADRFEGNNMLQLHLTPKEGRRVLHLFEYAAIENPIYKDFWDKLSSSVQSQIKNWQD